MVRRREGLPKRVGHHQVRYDCPQCETFGSGNVLHAAHGAREALERVQRCVERWDTYYSRKLADEIRAAMGRLP